MPLDLNVFDEDRFMGRDELAKNERLVTLKPSPDSNLYSNPNSNPSLSLIRALT